MRIGARHTESGMEFFAAMRSGSGRARSGREGLDQPLAEAAADERQAGMTANAEASPGVSRLRAAVDDGGEGRGLPEGFSLEADIQDGVIHVMRDGEPLPGRFQSLEEAVAASQVEATAAKGP